MKKKAHVTMWVASGGETAFIAAGGLRFTMESTTVDRPSTMCKVLDLYALLNTDEQRALAHALHVHVNTGEKEGSAT